MTSEPPTLVFERGEVRTSIDLRIYRLIAVKKAAYRLADRCTAMIGSATDDKLPLVFTFKPSAKETDALEAVRLFFQDLDQELREQIAEETGPMRTLILAQAFSRTDLIRRE